MIGGLDVRYPGQPRTPDGKFSGGGLGGGGGTDLGEASRAEQEAWFGANYPKDSMLYPELVEGYTHDGYAQLNSYQRGFYEPPTESPGFFSSTKSKSQLDRQTELLDEEMRNNPLPERMTVYRSLSIDWEKEESPVQQLFGGPGDVGASGRDRGFVSTSLRGDINKTIEGEYTLVMDVPKGTPAVGTHSVSAKPHEMEVVLGRNLNYTVTARDGDTIYVQVSQ